MITIKEANKMLNIAIPMINSSENTVYYQDDIIKAWQEAGLVELGLKELKKQLLSKVLKIKNHASIYSDSYNLAILILKYLNEEENEE